MSIDEIRGNDHPPERLVGREGTERQGRSEATAAGETRLREPRAGRFRARRGALREAAGGGRSSVAALDGDAGPAEDPASASKGAFAGRDRGTGRDRGATIVRDAGDGVAPGAGRASSSVVREVDAALPGGDALAAVEGGAAGNGAGDGRLTKRQKRRRRKPAAAGPASAPSASAPAPVPADPAGGGPGQAHPKSRRHRRKGGRRAPDLPKDSTPSQVSAAAAAAVAAVERTGQPPSTAGTPSGPSASSQPANSPTVASAPSKALEDTDAAGPERPAPPFGAADGPAEAARPPAPGGPSTSSIAPIVPPPLPPAEFERAVPPVYAALDLGTNNCRLLVAVPTRPGQFRVVDAFSRIVRLGEGLGRTGRLAGPAMDRAIAALAICAQKLSARTVAGARLIATEACRAAANGEEFIDRVRRETGLDLEIVSRETEARLAVSGCGSLVDRSAEGAVLFDIGGGSTEIALLDLRGGSTRRLSNHIVAWTSLPVGVVSLAEAHGGRDVGPQLFEAMIEEVADRIARFPGRGRLDELVGGPAFHLLGTSGTVTTLAGVHLGLERYDRRQVDGLWLSDAEVTELVARIAGWSFEERVANPCIGSDRADLVLAGCAILEAIRRVWPARSLRVADRGLREGLLTEMMVADGVWRRPAPARPKAMA